MSAAGGAAPWHVGLIVADLDAAMAELSAAQDLTFSPPQTREGDRGPFRLTFSTSRPYLELIEGVPGSDRDPTGGPRLHHLAYWTDRFTADRDRMLAAGYQLELQGSAPFGGSWCYLLAPASGLRVELCSQDGRSGFFARWDLPDGEAGS